MRVFWSFSRFKNTVVPVYVVRYSQQLAMLASLFIISWRRCAFLPNMSTTFGLKTAFVSFNPATHKIYSSMVYPSACSIFLQPCCMYCVGPAFLSPLTQINDMTLR